MLPLRSRATITGCRPTVVVLKLPAFGSSDSWATHTQVRSKILVISSSKIVGSVYIRPATRSSRTRSAGSRALTVAASNAPSMGPCRVVMSVLPRGQCPADAGFDLGVFPELPVAVADLDGAQQSAGLLDGGLGV